MALEEILDSVRRIIHKWVDTSSRIQTNVTRGDTVICVRSSRRFSAGDQVMLKNNTVYETGLVVDSIDSDTTLTFISPILNDWTVSQNTQLVKAIDENFVQGIYIGDPDVIPRFPAITVNGISRSSEWFTLESTKEHYELEINVYVQDSTHESGYRFLLHLVDTIQYGLKRNVFPLVNDYDIIGITENITRGEVVIKLSEANDVNNYKRIILEDEYNNQEDWIIRVYDADPSDGSVYVRLKDPVCYDFSISDTSVIVPKRFIYNSWPVNINYGKIHKGTLLKAATISWFADEEQMQ